MLHDVLTAYDAAITDTDRERALAVVRGLDLAAEAGETGRILGLPLRWMDASLDHLESVLSDTLARRLEGTSCPT